MNITQHRKEADKLRSRAEFFRRDSVNLARSAIQHSVHEEAANAKTDEDKATGAAEQATDLESQAMEHDREAEKLEQLARELEAKKEELVKQTNELDKEIQGIRGSSSVIDDLMGS